MTGAGRATGTTLLTTAFPRTSRGRCPYRWLLLLSGGPRCLRRWQVVELIGSSGSGRFGSCNDQWRSVTGVGRAADPPYYSRIPEARTRRPPRLLQNLIHYCGADGPSFEPIR